MKTKQPGTAVQAIRAIAHVLELQAKILGEIRQAQVNVAVGAAEPLTIIWKYSDDPLTQRAVRDLRKQQERAQWNELVPKLAAPTPEEPSREGNGELERPPEDPPPPLISWWR